MFAQLHPLTIFMVNYRLIISHKSFLSGKHGWQHNNQVLVGLLAQLVKHCAGIEEAMGSNPFRPEFFFRPYFRNCLSSVHYCEDRFHIYEIITVCLIIYSLSAQIATF